MESLKYKITNPHLKSKNKKHLERAKIDELKIISEIKVKYCLKFKRNHLAPTKTIPRNKKSAKKITSQF